jgi:hypothetical protein
VRSQFFSFLPTNDHFSSNWTSRVLGGKSDEFVVELLGVIARQEAEAEYRVLVHTDEPAGLPNPATFGNVMQQGHDLVRGQGAAEERGAFAFGKAGLAGAAAEQASLVRAVASGDGQVAVAAFAVIGALRVLTAKGVQLVHSALRGKVAVSKRSNLRSGSKIHEAGRAYNARKTRPDFEGEG